MARTFQRGRRTSGGGGRSSSRSRTPAKGRGGNQAGGARKHLGSSRSPGGRGGEARPGGRGSGRGAAGRGGRGGRGGGRMPLWMTIESSLEIRSWRRVHVFWFQIKIVPSVPSRSGTSRK
jgi:hypothetical protein